LKIAKEKTTWQTHLRADDVSFDVNDDVTRRIHSGGLGVVSRPIKARGECRE